MSLRSRVLRQDTAPEPQTPKSESVDETWSRLQATFTSLTGDVRSYLSSLPDRASMSDDRLRTQAESELIRLFKTPRFEMPAVDEAFLRRAVIDDILGFGPLQDLIDDPSVSEVMVNGANAVYVERSGTITKTERAFDTDEHLRRVVDRMLRASGRRVDQSSPMVDARLVDGSRLNVVLPPLSVDGPAVTIRKFHSAGFGIDDLIRQQSLSIDAARFLESSVAGRLNILVSGGTGTGKTTLLNVLSEFIGVDERVVTIEDAVELTPHMHNVVRLETRPPNAEGRGEIVVRDLVRNALRMRPDRIIVGEVRGSETIDMLQAMNTGHEGSLSTVHANSPRDALRRVETMVLLGGTELPLRAVREQVANSIDVIVHLVRDALGRRFVTRITEVVGMEGDMISMADLYSRDTQALAGASSLPELVSTGLASARLGSRHGSTPHVAATA
ncbi:MAG: CpaF family protein [Acidimicrobiia bacterium]|jgi:pilus assembly protein CpaF|nr:CpaF family protein [Acidimicrobiia bacterium]